MEEKGESPALKGLNTILFEGRGVVSAVNELQNKVKTDIKKVI